MKYDATKVLVPLTVLSSINTDIFLPLYKGKRLIKNETEIPEIFSFDIHNGCIKNLCMNMCINREISK